MCLPHPPTIAPQPTSEPSIAAATNLQLGGQQAPRGAAQLGRLALRFGAVDPTASPPPPPATTASGVAPAAASGAGTPQTTQTPNVPFAFGGVDGGYAVRGFGGAQLQ